MELDGSLGLWTMLDGPGADYGLGDTRRRIVQLVRDTGPIPPKAISEKLEINEQNARQTVRRMVKADELDTDGAGNYFEPLSPVTPVTEVTEACDSSDRTDIPDRTRTREAAAESYE